MTIWSTPEGFAIVRVIGPFDRESLPRGLLAEHRLKPDRWGHVRLSQGSVAMVWDDGTGRVDYLTAPGELIVPPQVSHHLEFADDFRLEIAFLERAAA